MNRTLFSLAIIRTNWDIYKKDYIENFVPLFATMIKTKQYSEISSDKLDIIREDFKNEYGLNIPYNPILSILNRLSKRKLIIREKGKFLPNKDKLEDIDITKNSNQVKREFEHVISSLQEFIKENHSIDLSVQDLEEALIAYLKKHDLDLLFAAEKNSLLPKIQSSKKIQYLINEFIGDVFRSKPDLFRFILNLTIGHALSATILFNDFNIFSGKFKNLNVFLDTPFIFHLMGVNGIHKKALAKELIDILLQQNVKLFVNEITHNEITSNLEETLELFEKGKRDPLKGPITFKSCIENGFNQNDVQQLLLELTVFYETNKLEYKNLPNYTDFAEHQIDEEKLYDTIVDTYSKFYPKKQEIEKETNNQSKEKEEKLNNTIFRDVQVLSGVYRFRLGNKPKTLKDCKYLFITTNSSLAFASRIFEKKEQGNKYTLPTCLTDVFLGTLIWLHSPAQIEVLNEKKIIADCYAALKPDEKLISRYLEDVERLRTKGVINDENYILLRTHRAAINILEDKTYGDLNEFTSQTAEDVLEELIQQIKGEEIEKLKIEREEHEKTKVELGKYKKSTNRVSSILSEKTQQDIQNKIERDKKIRNKATDLAKTTTNIIRYALLILLILPIIFLASEKFEFFNISTCFIAISWILTTFLGFINVLTGFNIKSFRDKIFDRLLYYFEKRIKTKLTEFE